MATIAPKSGIEPATELLAEVMTTEPYASWNRTRDDLNDLLAYP
jgi:hypothetical protein